MADSTVRAGPARPTSPICTPRKRSWTTTRRRRTWTGASSMARCRRDWRELQDRLSLALPGRTARLRRPRRCWRASTRPTSGVADAALDLRRPGRGRASRTRTEARLEDRDPNLSDLGEKARRSIERYIISEVLCYGVAPYKVMQLREDLRVAGDERALAVPRPPVRAWRPPVRLGRPARPGADDASAAGVAGVDPADVYAQRRRRSTRTLSAAELLELIDERAAPPLRSARHTRCPIGHVRSALAQAVLESSSDHARAGPRHRPRRLCHHRAPSGAAAWRSVYQAHHRGARSQRRDQSAVAVAGRSARLPGAVPARGPGGVAAAPPEHPDRLRLRRRRMASTYMVTELLPGGSLADRLGRPLPIERRAPGPPGIGAALDVAHAAGLIHRDVKPSNILFTRDGEPVLADFGIARIPRTSQHLTVQGTLIGTPHYMAPEMAAGEEVGPAQRPVLAWRRALRDADRRPPFPRPTPIAIVRAHIHETPPPISGPQPSSVARDRGGRRAGDGEASGRSLPDRRGAGQGLRGSRRANRATAQRPARHDAVPPVDPRRLQRHCTPRQVRPDHAEPAAAGRGPGAYRAAPAPVRPVHRRSRKLPILPLALLLAVCLVAAAGVFVWRSYGGLAASRPHRPASWRAPSLAGRRPRPRRLLRSLPRRRRLSCQVSPSSPAPPRAPRPPVKSSRLSGGRDLPDDHPAATADAASTDRCRAADGDLRPAAWPALRSGGVPGHRRAGAADRASSAVAAGSRGRTNTSGFWSTRAAAPKTGGRTSRS